MIGDHFAFTACFLCNIYINKFWVKKILKAVVNVCTKLQQFDSGHVIADDINSNWRVICELGCGLSVGASEQNSNELLQWPVLTTKMH